MTLKKSRNIIKGLTMTLKKSRNIIKGLTMTLKKSRNITLNIVSCFLTAHILHEFTRCNLFSEYVFSYNGSYTLEILTCQCPY